MVSSSAPDEGYAAEASATAVDDAPGKGTMVLGVILLLAILAAFGLLAYALLPADVAAEQDSGWLTMIVANRWLIWLIRMLVLVGLLMFMVFAVYFIRSIVVRIQLGHWLRRGGPFEAEVLDRAEHELDDVQWVFQALSEAEVRNSELEHQLGQTNEALQEVYQRFGEVLEENVELRAGRGAPPPGEEDPPWAS